MADQDVTHQLRGHRQKMGLVVESDGVELAQPEVDFIHQGGGLKRMPGAFVTQVLGGQAPEFGVNC